MTNCRSIGPSKKLPTISRKLIRLMPSVRLSCSPAGLLRITARRPNGRTSKADAFPGAGVPVATSTLWSIDSSQKILARGAVMSGASAKSQPPDRRYRSGRGKDNWDASICLTGRETVTFALVAIVLVSPQIFPSKPTPVKLFELGVVVFVLPISARCAFVLAGHDQQIPKSFNVSERASKSASRCCHDRAARKRAEWSPAVMHSRRASTQSWCGRWLTPIPRESSCSEACRSPRSPPRGRPRQALSPSSFDFHGSRPTSRRTGGD